MYLKKYFVLFASLNYFIFFHSCNLTSPGTVSESEVKTDLRQIKTRGKLVAITDYNTINYFIRNGKVMGFQLDLLKDFADFSGLRLELIAENNLNRSYSKLNEGECDLIAMNLAQTGQNEDLFSFTEPLMKTRQVLVQRKPVDWETMSASEVESKMVRNLYQLRGKTIYVEKNTVFASALKKFSSRILGDINVIEVSEQAEQLMREVAIGKIDYTLCDEMVASVNENYSSKLDVLTAMSDYEDMSWVVRKSSPELLQFINTWLVQYKKTNRYSILWHKYYKNPNYSELINNDYDVFSGIRISQYDDLIKKYSKELDWDWRLLAAMIYYESRFKSNAVSYRGAFGIMQLMPYTANRFGVNMASSPEAHIKAGVRMLIILDRKFYKEIPNKEERIKFVLAAYNIGIGHIIDAQVIAGKTRKNPSVWEGNVDSCLLSKSNPKYYQEPDIKCGYCIGKQTNKYVSEIENLYQHYKNIVRE